MLTQICDVGMEKLYRYVLYPFINCSEYQPALFAGGSVVLVLTISLKDAIKIYTHHTALPT